ncbi:MAG: DUF2490 domain-containing protein [Crocinitomicaceae bacterium]|nr:DUF2490 domain-containing protein [Crocinitomicaceae bacterium]
MKRFLQFFAIAALIVSANSARAQNDFGLWTSLEFSAPVTKDIKLGLNAQARFDNSVTRMNNAFLSPFIKWNAHKYFSVGANYRLQSVPYNGSTSNRVLSQRFTIDLEFRNITKLISKDSRLGLTLRLRGTSKIRKEKLTQNYLRFRLKADYNIPKTKLKPYIAAEMFLHFNDQIVYTFTEVRTKHNFNALRARLGFEYPIMKQHSVKFFGQYERQLISGKNDFVIGVGYAYDLKIKKKD